MKPITLTAERLREVLDYNQDTGEFTWKKTLSRRAVAGSVAGSIDKTTGYRRIRIDGMIHQAHRLAWLHATGAWPTLEIDHVDACRSNNVMTNLREVAHAINSQNQRRAHRSNKSSGLLGSSWDADKGAWMSHITLSYQVRFLGYFKTAVEAHERYLKEKRKIHEGCTI